MKVNLKHKDTGSLTQTKLGFSWTTFFFGFFPALFRGDWKWALIQFILVCVTWGISSIIFCFIYNKLYIKDLLEKGYIPADTTSKIALTNKGYIHG